jgi:SPP1 family predicted phage head-tail adaptor
MQAGCLTECIVIMRRVEERGAHGESVDTFVDYKTCRAQITAQNGRKALMNGEVWYPQTRAIKIRYDRSVQETMRVKHRGQVFEITAITHDLRDQSTTIAAELINE